MSGTLKAEDVVFDLDRPLLYPLRIAFGRTPTTVMTTLTCFYPQCLRASDDQCGEPIIPAGDKLKDRPLQKDQIGQERLCLRVAISKGPPSGGGYPNVSQRTPEFRASKVSAWGNTRSPLLARN
ncbi:MAG TPA: hypothetical protein VGN91_20650 [Bosea sp. (in: a-proteobacteria)]|nr:hypothetical protein [Bosea sp. (in: a-proteobacteria)]